MKIIVSDNEQLVQDIRQKLKDNGGYCPCKIIKNQDTKCVCREFLEQEELGECHCGLYRKVQL